MMDLKKQLAALYTSTFFSGLRLTDAVWVALLAARGFSLWEIGVAEAVYHIVCLVCEVPSGMAADLLGRRRTYLLGSVFALLHDLLMLCAEGLPAVCLAMGLGALSGSMFSGTSAALTYDSLQQAGRSGDYLPVSARLEQINLAAGGLGSLASLAHRALGYAGFYLASALCQGASALASLLLAEPVVTEAQARRGQYTLRQLPQRFVQQGRDAAAVLRGCPAAVRLLAADGLVSVPVYLVTMYLQQRLVELGWPAGLLFLPHLLGRGAAIAGTALACRVRPRGLRPLYLVCAPVCGAGAVLVGLAPAPAALAGAMLVQGILSVWTLHADRRLNELFPSDQRATLVSVDSMAYSLLMIPASPLTGWVGDLAGQAGAGLAALGLLVALSALAAAKPRR